MGWCWACGVDRTGAKLGWRGQQAGLAHAGLQAESGLLGCAERLAEMALRAALRLRFGFVFRVAGLELGLGLESGRIRV